MSAPLESDPSLVASAEGSTAGPAGLEPGQRNVIAGRYRLVEFIAEGGMGSVYLAEHVLSRKKLAVKVVHPYLCKGRHGVERFRREVSAAATIDHPGIVQVYDAGVDDDGGFFMAMELLKGESLGDLLRREWPGMRRSVELVEGMLEPLAKAHAKGFVHRDLKPDNIFLAVDEEGRERVKLLDFGLAREVTKGGPTRTGITFGTPEYMSPEQAISARQVQPPGDVWSVGVMLYELLSGVHPFSGETPNAIMANAIKEPLPPLSETAPHVPAALGRFIERCLDKKPENRPADAGEMLAELRAVLEKVTLDDTVPSAPVAPPKWNESDSAGEVSVLELPSRRASLEVPVEVRTDAGEGGRPSKRRTLIVVGLGAALAGLAGIAGVLVALSDGGSDVVEDGPALVEHSSAAVSAEAQGVVEDDPTPSPPEGMAETSAPSPEVVSEAPANAEPSAQEEVTTHVDVPPHRGQRRQVRRQPEGPSALEQARDCLAQNDRQCAKRILEARARSVAEHALLIDTYRSLGEIGPMLDRMERFVRRYPNARQSNTYREDLRRYGRSVP